MFIQVLHKGIPHDVEASSPGTVWFMRLVDPQMLRPGATPSGEMSLDLQCFANSLLSRSFHLKRRQRRIRSSEHAQSH